MNIIKRLLSFYLVLCMLFTSGIVEVIATSVQTQEKTQPDQQITVPLADVSDLFVVSETEPVQEPASAEATELTEVTSGKTVPVRATVKGESQNFSYEVLQDGSCCITGYSGDTYENLQIPETLDGYAVTAIGASAFKNVKALISVVLPAGVTTLENYAFENCTALESIALGNSLTSIGYRTFAGCTSLMEIDLPDTVKTIGADAFGGCTSLSQFTYPLALEDVGSSLGGGIFEDCTALTSVEVPEGVTVLPDHVFQNAKSLQSVSLPSTLTTVGESAFAKSGIVTLELPAGVTAIDSYAFENCTALESIALGNSLTSIGYRAFAGCTSLMEIDLPDIVETIGSGAFNDCTALIVMNLPAALRDIGSSVFQNCTSLETVVFCDGITTLKSDTFNGCSSLRSVHLPRDLKTIQSKAFANCVTLTEIYIPNSVTTIADNAFQGTSGITFRCALDSYATEFALDHQYPIIPTKIDNEESNSPLNTENSYYIHNYDGLSAAGVMSMVVHYEMQENAGVFPTAITVHIYDYAALQENTLTLDGVLCTNYEYDEETGRLTVPVEAASGTLRFCMKPLRYEALTSYARLICADSKGKTSIEVIGAVNSLIPVLNISAREETSLSSVDVRGLAIPEAEVSLYVDGVFTQTVKANKVGDYSATVSLGEPIDGKEYVITAEAADRNGAVVVAQTNVTFRKVAPELVDFVMIYNDRRMSLKELQGTRPVVIFRQSPFRFEINFTPAEGLKNVYVVSTRNNVKKYLQAVWNEELGLFVAEGYFDPLDHSYIPGELEIEYVLYGEKVSFDQPIDFSSQEAIDALPQVWKDAQVDILENSQERIALDMTVGEGEQQISFVMDVSARDIPSYLNESNAANYGYTKITDDYGKTLYVREHSGGGAAIEGGNIFDVVDFAKGQATGFTIEKFTDAAGKFVGDVSGFGLFANTIGIFKNVKDWYDMSNDISELEEKYNSDPNISAHQKKLFKEQAMAAHDVIAWGTLLKCGLSVMSMYGLVLGGTLAGPVFFAGAFLTGMLFDGIMQYVMCDLYATAYGEKFRFKWAIDPSGYVYDQLTGKRLSDVTVHAYWIENTGDDPNFWDNKPGDDEYGVLWAAMEYSQMNPLLTDGDGRYAWDVPEGWWRVSYEKEGYESTWSEWLPVPPPQTEVNIAMMPIGGGIRGDLNGDSTVDEDDAIYLLRHVLMPESFQVNQAVDYDKSGMVNEDDAIYLLRHVLMPGSFPL